MKHFYSKIINLINKLLYYFFKLLPIKNHLILFESEGDLSDNSYALYDFMKNNQYFRKYTAIWLVKSTDFIRKNKYENTVFCTKFATKIEIKRAYYLAVSKYYIYDHYNIYSYLKKRKDQILVYLSHGSIFKAPKGVDEVLSKNDINYITGKVFEKGMEIWTGCDKAKIFDYGFPRLDYFKDKMDKIILTKLIGDKAYNKYFLWMPTFRESTNKNLSEKIMNETGLPMFSTIQELQLFDSYLAERNAVCILKVHHLQKRLSVFDEHFSNIFVLSDEDINVINIQLYQFITVFDALISDYSSVSFDYMLLNKPIIFTLDDIKEYENGRGEFIFDPLPLFYGYKVKDMNEFYIAIDKVLNGIDEYKIIRENNINAIHTYKDFRACERILKHLNIYI